MRERERVISDPVSKQRPSGNTQKKPESVPAGGAKNTNEAETEKIPKMILKF